MFHIHRVMFMIALLSVALTGCVTDPDQRAIDDNGSVVPVQSARDLEIHLRTTPNSPIHRLSAAAERRFLDSLVFAKGGLGSYGYYELETLPPLDIYEILSLFGVEDTTQLVTRAHDPDHRVLRQRDTADGMDFYCDGSRCYRQLGSICLRTCG